MVARMRGLYYAAAATTAIAGILHLIIATKSGFDLVGAFFIVAGSAQLTWVVPMIGRWGLPWYYVGIGGTVVLMILFVMNNPITGIIGLEIEIEYDLMAIVIELLEAAFIGLTAAIIVRESRLKRIAAKMGRKTDTEAA
jgi:hypothetical protein